MMTPRRDKFRYGLYGVYLPYYESLCANLDEKWQPYSGFRDFDAQDILYAKGRTSIPLGKAFEVTNAKGGQSPHNYGCATDWTIFEEGRPIWLKKTDPLWQEYIQAIEKVGLRCGVEFGDVDHNELALSVSWAQIYGEYQSGGLEGAAAKIHASSG